MQKKQVKLTVNNLKKKQLRFIQLTLQLCVYHSIFNQFSINPITY